MSDEGKSIYAYMNLKSYKKATAAQYQSVEDRAQELRPKIESSAREKEKDALEAAKLKVY